jgi:SAM-dependent methyltransferase
MTAPPVDVQAEYNRFLAASIELGAPEHFIQFSKLFAEQQIWKSYAYLLDSVPARLEGGVAVDIGCKYGHVMPLFLARGARAAIGVDVVEEYLAVARRVVGAIYPPASFLKSKAGYLPIESGSVSFVLLNEVISHVNPMYLPNLYFEVARILRPGGHLVISDGNNIANPDCRRDLTDVYDAWENGPSGRKTSRDVVDGAFVDIRRRLIRERHRALSDAEVDYLARNTSGLFGDYLAETVDRYVAGGGFVARPYRHGICPTSPLDGGAVMEFGYHPKQVVMTLAAFGIHARRADPPPPLRWGTPRAAIGSVLSWSRHHANRLLRRFPGGLGEGWGFQIHGVKVF